MFSKITFLKSVLSNEKDEACFGFLEEIFTKSVHRGGVMCHLLLSTYVSSFLFPKKIEDNHYNKTDTIFLNVQMGHEFYHFINK